MDSRIKRPPRSVGVAKLSSGLALISGDMLMRSLLRGRALQRLSAFRVRPSIENLEERCLPSADVVLEWNAIALDALKNDSTLGASSMQMGPTRASRAFAIVQSAVFDAINSIDGSYDPYLIQVNAPRDASITAAGAQAAHDTLVALFPQYTPTLDARLAADLAGIHASGPRAEGVAVGHIVAEGVLAIRSHDGADVPMSYTFGSGPGAWQVDPLHPTQHA